MRLKIQNRFLITAIILLLYIPIYTPVYSQAKVSVHDISEINIRDPYIVADTETRTYYMYKSAAVINNEGKSTSGVVTYKSKDLKSWEGPYTVFSTPSQNWATGAIWAPEVHVYNGKYYLFATMNGDIEFKKAQANWPKYTFRGTQIFYSDSPEGPFKPFNYLPHTPIDRMALDGTLWVEDGIPYMIYCHEWVQIADGSMELVKLKPDLSGTDGPSTTLFYASAAEWSTGSKHPSPLPVSYVTDGCFVYRTKTGKLLMIWSSFMNNEYAIGIAESVTGKITGPWKQQEKPLFTKNGGHGMIFKTFDNRLCITLHGPNSPSRAERARIFELEDTGETLQIIEN